MRPADRRPLQREKPGWHNIPERRDMTLCIAAPCTHDGQPAIVICADTQGTDYTTKSFDTYKIRVLEKANTAVMFCDMVSAAKELMTELDPIITAALSKASVAVFQISLATE